MASGTTALHVFADTFRKLAEEATEGAVTIRVFPSGTLGQEREVVQQVQEGLVDFMVSGTAIWGSVAPKLQVFDFPFMWRDWAHVHSVVDGPVGREAADYLERSVRMRPFAWGDSFGFRQVITRSRDVTETSQLAGLKIRTIQSPIYVKAVELMGASPTPMAFGEVYTSLQTGVIDGYEHDASTTLQQRFYEIAGFMARTRHIAGVLGLWASAATLARLSPGPPRRARRRRARSGEAAARDGSSGGHGGDRAADEERHDHPRHRRPRAAAGGRAALGQRGARARHHGVARGDPRVSAPTDGLVASIVDRTSRSNGRSRSSWWRRPRSSACRSSAATSCTSPIPWTEEIARLLLAWLMCVGGIAALRHAQHPRVTALVRLLSEPRRQAVDRGLRLVLLAFFGFLIVPAYHLTVASAGESLPASGISGAWISRHPAGGARADVARSSSSSFTAKASRPGASARRSRWSLGTAGVAIASVLIPLLAGAAPLVVLVIGFLVTGALGLPLAFTLALTSLTYLLGIGGVGLIILPIKILGGVDSFVLLAIPLFILAGALMESGGISERIVDLAMAIVGKVRGGLAMVVVVAEILFSGISGSTAADVSAISSLLVPSMRRAGYSGPESVSVVAAASAMGILVPPCLTMVVLGSLVNLSIVTLFLAGFVPAFILAAALLVLIAVRARRQNWPVTTGASRRRISAGRSGARLFRPGSRSCSSAASSLARRP